MKWGSTFVPLIGFLICFCMTHTMAGIRQCTGCGAFYDTDYSEDQCPHRTAQCSHYQPGEHVSAHSKAVQKRLQNALAAANYGLRAFDLPIDSSELINEANDQPFQNLLIQNAVAETIISGLSPLEAISLKYVREQLERNEKHSDGAGKVAEDAPQTISTFITTDPRFSLRITREYPSIHHYNFLLREELASSFTLVVVRTEEPDRCIIISPLGIITAQRGNAVTSSNDGFEVSLTEFAEIIDQLKREFVKELLNEQEVETLFIDEMLTKPTKPEPTYPKSREAFDWSLLPFWTKDVVSCLILLFSIYLGSYYS